MSSITAEQEQASMLAFQARNRARTSGRKETLHYVFTNAIEGGINYWAETEDYHHSKKGGILTQSGANDIGTVDDLDNFYARIVSTESDWGVSKAYQPNTLTKYGHAEGMLDIEPDCELTIDIDVIERGVNLFVDKVIEATKSEDPAAPFSRTYWRQFVVQWLTDCQDGDSDIEVTDAIVQLGLFGELVYS